MPQATSVSLDAYRDLLRQTDSDIYNALIGEEERQKSGIELIPSENYTYPEVLAALGSVFTNKYSEGYPGRRYYGGQQYTDVIENIARERACRLFRAEYANVQPLSGSPMNQAVYMAFLEPGDTVLLLNYEHHRVDSPFRSSFAIYIREGEETFDAVDEIPVQLRKRLLALRGYDKDGMLRAADIIDGREVETGIDSLFSDPAVAYIHAHFAKPGCYAALIERAT